jgi:hypothetical protein
MPSDAKLIMMITTALIALNQANATGNYTVLYQLAAPSFQQANSPQRLAKIFGKLRSRNIDLSSITVLQPKLFQRPEINSKGFLRMAGFFPTSPEQLNFDLIYQPINGQWVLFGIAATTAAPQSAQPAQTAQPAQQAPGAQPATVPTPAATKPVEPAGVQSAKPASSAKKPPAQPKATAAEVGDTAPPDVRDRIDNPPPPPPAAKPKEEKKGLWNPFGR